MLFDIDVTMDYQLSGADTALLTLEAAQTEGQNVLQSSVEIENADLARIEGEGGLGQRIWARVHGDRLKLQYSASVAVTRPEVQLAPLAQMPWHSLSRDVVTYLRPSRFCQSDLFMSFVGQQFGDLRGGARIAAIVDWVAGQLAYVPGSSNAETTAIDTFVTRAGVCRDFAHLVCSLARASNIPARYVSAYGADVTPPDFHAVAQVWLDGGWHLVDATGMSAAPALVVIGAGRDAGDVAFMETEQWADPIWQNVSVSRA